MKVDPKLPEHADMPLWVVYGLDCFPSMICCKISHRHGEPVIWGFSIYRRTGGFRTLGQNLATWIDAEKARGSRLPEFYNDHEMALDKLRKLTTPKGAT